VYSPPGILRLGSGQDRRASTALDTPASLADSLRSARKQRLTFSSGFL